MTQVGAGSAVPGTDLLTMAEAARIKGVSYHTVSRAVRRGRLPVQRLGRMALIAAQDLAAWQPMTERRPRRYQQRDEERSLHVFGQASDDAIAITESFADLTDAMHLQARTADLRTFLQTGAARIAEGFGFTWISIWHWIIAEPGGTLLLMARVRSAGMGNAEGRAHTVATKAIDVHPQSALADVISGSSPHVVTHLPPEAAGMLGVPDRTRPTMVAPVRAARGLLGIVVAQGGSEAPTAGELRILSRLLDHLASGWVSVEDRITSMGNQRALEAALDLAPVGVRVVRTDGWEFRNQLDAERFSPDSGTSAVVDAEIASGRPSGEMEAMRIQDDAGRTLDVQVHRVDDVNVPVGPAGVTIAVSTEVPIASPARASRGSLRRGEPGDAASAWALSDVMRAVQGAPSAVEVIRRGAALTVAALGGDGALFELRDRDGMFRRIPFDEWDAGRDSDRQHAPLAFPTTVLAFAGRRPVLLARHDAATFERETMERMGWTTMLVMPLISQDEQLGFAMIGFAGDEQASCDVVSRADELAGTLAEAIVAARAMERLTEELRHFTAVLDQVPQAVLIGEGGEGVIGFANQAAADLWRWPEDRPPRTIADLVVLDAHGEPVGGDLHPLMLAARTGRALLGEPLTIRTDAGDVVDVLGTIAPVLSQDGTIGGTVVILQDRSQFRRLEEAKEAFVALVAHELRNPLTAVVGNVQLLERRLRREPSIADPAVRERVEVLAQQVDLIARLVTRLLDRSRLEFGRLDIAPVETDAVAIVQRACDDAALMLGDRPLQISAPAHLAVRWDEVRMRQVMANLLSNAVRHGRGAIEVSVEVIAASGDESGEMASERIRIGVRDHGPGINPSVRARLFSPHPRRGEDRRLAPTSDAQGLGIGLFLSERIVAAHGGTAHAEDAEGGGARMVIELPAVALPGSVTGMEGVLHYNDA
ncbi:MAG: ATP-binding protein [Thermomicrobiales bacterium]